MSARKVAAYRHPPVAASTQAPDTRPGNYYVSIVDGSRVGLLAGPFKNDHASNGDLPENWKVR